MRRRAMTMRVLFAVAGLAFAALTNEAATFMTKYYAF